MPLSERVARLRRQSIDAGATISTERAELVTEFYSEHEGSLPSPLMRALAFKHIMERKSISILEGELIVGERGPTPKATSTYPVVCCQSLQDLEILDTREKVSFSVDAYALDPETFVCYHR